MNGKGYSAASCDSIQEARKNGSLTISAKKIKTPKLFAKTQIIKQNRPAMNVHVPAVLIRPAASLK